MTESDTFVQTQIIRLCLVFEPAPHERGLVERAILPPSYITTELPSRHDVALFKTGQNWRILHE